MFFKYYNFIVNNLNHLINFTNINHFNLQSYDILLPAGISFYTFQTMSYTIDVYKGCIKPAKTFVEFSFFVSFFAQLIAGPIVRAKDFLPQIKDKLINNFEVFDGISLILKGLIKKIIFADLLAVLLVDKVFLNPTAYNSIDVLLAAYGYAFQIYFDFSAYSDIAIGSGLLFGYKIPINFNRPYMAFTPSDFWKRWHISLSQWLRDYLFIPLGGSKVSNKRILINLIITMFLGGLWHGAAWNFVIWGLLHALYLIIYRFIPEKFLTKNPFRLWLNRIIFFHLICFTWIFFRCGSYSLIKKFFAAFGNTNNNIQMFKFNIIVLLLFCFMLHFTPSKIIDNLRNKYIKLPEILQALFTLLLAGLLMSVQQTQIPFIYFQF